MRETGREQASVATEAADSGRLQCGRPGEAYRRGVSLMTQPRERLSGPGSDCLYWWPSVEREACRAAPVLGSGLSALYGCRRVWSSRLPSAGRPSDCSDPQTTFTTSIQTRWHGVLVFKSNTSHRKKTGALRMHLHMHRYVHMGASHVPSTFSRPCFSLCRARFAV